MERSLHDAALKGSVTSLLELLQQDPLILDRMMVDCVAETPLHIAAILGHVDFVRELASRKPELARELNSRRQSPLHLASAKGYVEIVKFLLSRGPDMCLARDRDGKTPLHLAAIKGQVKVLEELVRAKPDAIRVPVDRGQTILYLCVKHGHLEALELLWGLIGDHDFVNSKDDDGNTVLHFSAAEKQFEAIEFLLSRTGVKVNSLNANGFTALDVLTHSPRDLKDTDIGEALRDAGTLRARDIPTAARENEITWTSSNRPITANGTPMEQPPFSQGSSWQVYLQKHGDWLDKQRSTLMVVASLIAAMTFQAGVNPPGGVWQDDLKPNYSNGTPDTPGHDAGESIMADKFTSSYVWYLGFNTTAFASSLSIILLLISGLPMRRRIFMWIFMVIMWVAISSAALTYEISILAIISEEAWNALPGPMMYFVLFVWIGLTALLFLGHTIRLLLKLLTKWRKRGSENPQASV